MSAISLGSSSQFMCFCTQDDLALKFEYIFFPSECVPTEIKTQSC